MTAQDEQKKKDQEELDKRELQARKDMREYERLQRLLEKTTVTVGS